MPGGSISLRYVSGNKVRKGCTYFREAVESLPGMCRETKYVRVIHPCVEGNLMIQYKTITAFWHYSGQRLTFRFGQPAAET